MALHPLRQVWRKLPLKFRHLLIYKLGLLKITQNKLVLNTLNTFRYNLLIYRQNSQTQTSLEMINQKTIIKFVLTSEFTPELKKTITSLNKQSYQCWNIYIICNRTHATSYNKLKKLSDKIFLVDSFRAVSNIDSNRSYLFSNLIPGQIFSENSLKKIIKAFDEHEDVQAIYTDDDYYSHLNLRFNHNLKPDWDENYFFNFDYIGNSVFFSSRILTTNNTRVSTPYELILNCNFKKIRHIPEPIISYPIKCRDKTHIDLATQLELLKKYFISNKIDAKLDQSDRTIDIKYRLQNEPLTSIIIPTRNSTHLLRQCIESILKNTDYKNYEIIVVNNQSDEPDFFRYLESLKSITNITLLNYDAEFNYSAINNYAAQKANGEVIILLNNDIEIVSPNWLEQLVTHAINKNTGCVGSKLIYPNGRIQHAGIIIGLGGVAGHIFKGESGTSHGYQNRLICDQNYSAVTAACLAIKKDTFLELGGLDEENLKVAFNDVDLCLKSITHGYTNKCLFNLKIIHHESATRGYDTTPKKLARFEKEIEFMKKKWRTEFYVDPSSNPNFSKNSERLIIKRG